MLFHKVKKLQIKLFFKKLKIVTLNLNCFVILIFSITRQVAVTTLKRKVKTLFLRALIIRYV